MNKENKNSTATKVAGKSIFVVSIISIWSKITSFFPWLTSGLNWLWFCLGIIGIILALLLIWIIWIHPWHIARVNAKMVKASEKTINRVEAKNRKKLEKKNKKNHEPESS